MLPHFVIVVIVIFKVKDEEMNVQTKALVDAFLSTVRVEIQPRPWFIQPVKAVTKLDALSRSG